MGLKREEKKTRRKIEIFESYSRCSLPPSQNKLESFSPVQ
jgi:hypothetical protein